MFTLRPIHRLGSVAGFLCFTAFAGCKPTPNGDASAVKSEDVAAVALNVATPEARYANYMNDPLRFGTYLSKPLWCDGAFQKLFVASGQSWDTIWAKYGIHRVEDGARNKYGYYNQFPMGMIETFTEANIDGIKVTGQTVTCEGCHSSMLFGQYVPGLANPWFDWDSLYVDLKKACGEASPAKVFPRVVPGNAIANAADHLGMFGAMIRNDDMSLNDIGKKVFGHLTTVQSIAKNTIGQVWDLSGDVIQKIGEATKGAAYLRTPSWFAVSIKAKPENVLKIPSSVPGSTQSFDGGLYYDGRLSHTANPSDYTYMVTYANTVDGALFKSERQHYRQMALPKIVAMSDSTPKFRDFGFPVDDTLAGNGATIYAKYCATCHGTPSPGGYAFKSKIVPLSRIQTDPRRALFPEDFITKNNSVLPDSQILPVGPNFTEERRGYVTPALNGIWARAPYLHNGSVPTIRELLKPSAERPTTWRLAANPNNKADYNQADIGWRVTLGKDGTGPLYDRDSQIQYGMSNSGHEPSMYLNPQKPRLTDDEVNALLEYLKTI